MMNRMLVCIVLLSLVLAGCAPSLKSKTIIIPETGDSGSSPAANEAMELSAIYKLSENGNILGWQSKDELLGTIWKTSRSRSLDRIDYKHNSYETWINLEGSTEIQGLSPDGSFAVSSVQADRKETMKLLRLTGSQPVEIGELSTEAMRVSMLTWSNNSRYTAYSEQKTGQAGRAIAVYDTAANKMKEYPIPDWNVLAVKISNDGSSALLVRSSGRQYSLVYGKLDETGFASLYEHDIAGDFGTFDFMNDDQVMLVGSSGALIVFDRRNNTTSVVTEQIGSFRLSPDRKMIVYSRGRDSLYVAKVQGNSLLNEKEVYKGIVPFQLEWSPDNKKIVLNGNKAYEPRPVASAQVVVTDPLILELK
ncbi:hypothetical protein DVH26_29995 [Paenibacillus sp. H1-7]|uniref:hypothetical protein n=1 Tax=Paenibacillus sp. H1-7 TaxID=2282849 RepID=UPI001EF84DAF|nr:hypothetical protein [Paenibacillus sp. H1-7]ULL18324.1 hypothetical protein DVH26_29995 [Paenibacillus sp. H1-7]